MIIYANEGFDAIECTRTYVVQEAVRTIQRISSSETVVFNEDTNNSDEIVLSFQTKMLLNGVPQSINSGISYTVTSADTGLVYALSGSTLTITPSRMPDMFTYLGYNLAAHYTGEIIIKAYITSKPSIYTTYNVEVRCHSISALGVQNTGKYISIPFSDISSYARPGLFSDALSSIGMSSSTCGSNITGSTGYSPQMEFFEMVRGANVVAIHSHGDPGILPINTDRYTPSSNVTVSDIGRLHDGFFASTNLILMLSCHAGEGTGPSTLSPSLLSAFCNKGVQCGIGYSNSVMSVYAQAFETEFYNQITLYGNQKTISELYSGAYYGCPEKAREGLSFEGSSTSKLND